MKSKEISRIPKASIWWVLPCMKRKSLKYRVFFPHNASQLGVSWFNECIIHWSLFFGSFPLVGDCHWKWLPEELFSVWNTDICAEWSRSWALLWYDARVWTYTFKVQRNTRFKWWFAFFSFQIVWTALFPVVLTEHLDHLLAFVCSAALFKPRCWNCCCAVCFQLFFCILIVCNFALFSSTWNSITQTHQQPTANVYESYRLLRSFYVVFANVTFMFSHL